MKQLLLSAFASVVLATPALAKTTIAVSMAHFDDTFPTIQRKAMATEARAKGVDIQFEDAQGDIGKQLSQIQNFAAQKVGAIIVNPVDTSVTPKMTKLAVAAHIPQVYVNHKPIEPTLPDSVSFVGSDEKL